MAANRWAGFSSIAGWTTLTSGTIELRNNLNNVRLLSDREVQVGWGRKKSASDLIILDFGAIKICKHQRLMRPPYHTVRTRTRQSPGN